MTLRDQEHRLHHARDGARACARLRHAPEGHRRDGRTAVGDVDEEAIPEADLPGEATVKAGASKTVVIKLTPGTYTMICNIDTTAVRRHGHQPLREGMHAVFTAS